MSFEPFFDGRGSLGSVPLFQSVLDHNVSWFLLVLGVEWEWILWRSNEGILVGETPGFKGEAVWSA